MMGRSEMRQWGPPPRGRGKGTARSGNGGGLGITPAWAGKRRSMTARGRVRRDHPRVGGEKFSRYRARESNQGSPPHGRGKARSRCFVVEVMRITPAWAGKSISLHAHQCARKDHPRMGGEKMSGAISAEISLGLPPRRRGKSSAPTGHDGNVRITPA